MYGFSLEEILLIVMSSLAFTGWFLIKGLDDEDGH